MVTGVVGNFCLERLTPSETHSEGGAERVAGAQPGSPPPAPQAACKVIPRPAARTGPLPRAFRSARPRLHIGFYKGPSPVSSARLLFSSQPEGSGISELQTSFQV